MAFLKEAPIYIDESPIQLPTATTISSLRPSCSFLVCSTSVSTRSSCRILQNIFFGPRMSKVLLAHRTDRPLSRHQGKVWAPSSLNLQTTKQIRSISMPYKNLQKSSKYFLSRSPHSARPREPAEPELGSLCGLEAVREEGWVPASVVSIPGCEPHWMGEDRGVQPACSALGEWRWRCQTARERRRYPCAWQREAMAEKQGEACRWRGESPWRGRAQSGRPSVLHRGYQRAASSREPAAEAPSRLLTGDGGLRLGMGEGGEGCRERRDGARRWREP